jgi:hypothetical protein
MVGPIDGRVELQRTLSDSFAATGFAAVPERELYRALQAGLDGSDRESYEPLVARLIREVGIWWSPNAYALFPILVPWAVRDRSCRYDAGPEAWGSPRADGYLRDDNSIIKKLPLSAHVAAPASHAYASRKPWRGFTACHVWRDLPDGVVAGEDAWLYSFLPNLVWLPTPIAPLTDRQGSFVQQLLQHISIRMFSREAVAQPLAAYADVAWAKLPAPPRSIPDELVRPDGLACFEPSAQFFRRRLSYNRRLTTGVAAIAEGRRPDKKIICSRYTTGLPELPMATLSEFSSLLRAYDDAVASSITA